MPWFPVPLAPGMGLSRHPGAARHQRHRRHPAAPGEAVDGLPASVHLARGAVRVSCPGRLERRLDRGAGRLGHLPADAPDYELRTVVPVGVLASAPPTTPSRGSRSAPWLVHVAVKLPVIRDRPRRGRRPRRTAGPSADVGAVSRRGLLRSTWLAPASRSSPRPAARCRGCAGSRRSRSAPATGPRACPSTVRPGGAGSPRPRRAPAYVLEVQPATETILLTPRGAAAMPSAPRSCRSPASRAGARGHLDRRAGQATCWPQVGAGPSDVARRSLQERGPYRRHDAAGALRGDELTLLALQLNGGTWRSTTATRRA